MENCGSLYYTDQNSVKIFIKMVGLKELWLWIPGWIIVLKGSNLKAVLCIFSLFYIFSPVILK
jgi:hypothetical protein